MSLNDYLTALGAVIAGLAALAASFYSRRAIEFSRLAQSAAEEATIHASHANVLSANAWVEQYFCNVRQWADEVCDNISVAVYEFKIEGPDRHNSLRTSLQRLSSHIDRGRWFFPNFDNEIHGQHKAAAYQGVRQPILECLIEAHEIVLSALKGTGQIDLEELIACQREFVSEVQQVLNPRRRQDEVERVYAQFAVSERMHANQQGGR